MEYLTLENVTMVIMLLFWSFMFVLIIYVFLKNRETQSGSDDRITLTNHYNKGERQ